MSTLTVASRRSRGSSAENRVFTHHVPPITMGCGAAEELPTILSSFGSKIFVVTDPGVAQQPFFDLLLANLHNKGFQTRLFRDVLPDPPVDVFETCAAQASEFGPACFLGIGGGSALDVTKIVAVLGKHDCSLPSLFGIDQVPGRGVPSVLASTTAGTGSEVTPIAVVSDEENQLKKGIVSDFLVANHAVVDPCLCETLPAWPTAYTGMDALTHAIEAYTNQYSVPLIDGYALEAIQLIASNLPTACHHGSDLAARYGMSRASMFGGMCLGPVNTAAVHALAYPLGGRFKVPHGVANSLLLPHVMEFNMPAVAERYQIVAETMGRGDGDAVAAVEELSAEVGTNRTMAEFGVTQADLPSMAADAIQVTRLMRNNPREMSEQDALAIYQAAL
jgi:alcohol dehydrogenase class IV